MFTSAMKNQPVVNIGGALEQDADRILRDVAGVSVEAPLSDGGCGFVIIWAGDVIEVKAQRLTNAAAAHQPHVAFGAISGTECESGYQP